MEHKFQINLRGIIDLLSEHLYSGPEVFVRELLQNAVDAITARVHHEKDFQGDIQIEVHAPKGKPPTVVFTDNGIGLTQEEVHRFLSTIGLSSKRAADGDMPTDFIGRFGIGILSCFVVSDEIVLITRSAKDQVAKPLEWRAKGDGTYSLKELDREFDPGTQVWLTAKSTAAEHFAAERIRELVEHFGILLPFPIRVLSGRTSVIVNEAGAPWRKSYKSEKDRQQSLLRYGQEAFGLKFFDAIPLRCDIGEIDGAAFILPHHAGATIKRKHRVYLKNMYLSDSVDNLLPDWAFFVQAVINAGDLRPTASRESLYEDAKLAKVREQLGDCLRNYLVHLAEHRPERLHDFVGLHQRALKALAVEDEEFYKIIIDHIPFETSLGSMTFGEYRRENTVIRYVSNVDTFRQTVSVAAAQGMCVINAGYVYETELLTRAPEVFDELTLQELDPESLSEDFEDLSSDEAGIAIGLVEEADRALKPYRVRAEAKRFRPENLPVLFVSSTEERFLRNLERTKEVANPLWSGVLDGLSAHAPARSSFLCFNFTNALVRKAAELSIASAPAVKERLARIIRMLYVQALLLGHHPLTAKEMTILNEGLLGMIEESVTGNGPTRDQSKT